MGVKRYINTPAENTPTRNFIKNVLGMRACYERRERIGVIFCKAERRADRCDVFVKMGQAESNRADEIKDWMDTRMKEKEEELEKREEKLKKKLEAIEKSVKEHHEREKRLALREEEVVRKEKRRYEDLEHYTSETRNLKRRLTQVEATVFGSQDRTRRQ